MITSTSNQQIKDIRKLRDRKYREESGLFFVEGIRLVNDALRDPKHLDMIVYSPDLSRSENILEIIGQAKKFHLPVLEVSGEVFKTLSSKDGPQGVAAVVKRSWDRLQPESKLPGWWTVLIEIADPGNLGTILRTSDATAGKGVILVGNCTDPFDPTSVRASMGSIFSQKLIRSDRQVFINWAANNRARLIGTSDHATTDYKQCSYSPETILVMGSERQGIPGEVMAICQEVVSIPMSGISDSLNLAVAASVMMYERFEHLRKRI